MVAPTDAERALSDLFEARAKHFTEKPLDVRRADAFRRFAAAGLPHRRVEAYKYTDLKARLRTLPAAARAASADEIARLAAAHPPLSDAARIVIANGRFAPDASAAPQNATLHGLLDAGAPVDRVGSLVADSDDPLTLANVGLFDGGIVLHVTGDAGDVDLLHLATEDALIMGRVAVIVESGASVRVVERFAGATHALNNTLVELFIADDADASWVRVTDGAENSVHLSSHHIEMGKDAKLDHLTVATGLGLARNQAFCHVAGDEAEANFRTATVAIGERHADTTLIVRHNALHSNSSEVFRSAVGKGGVAVIQGRINVDPGAQKTDAAMMSNALFLDDTGEVVNKPELEIYADDVICGHGATSGDLDDDPIFYLRARGIPEATARQLLVEAFLVEALENVGDETLKAALEAQLRTALAAA
ncbi:MAG: Fe-S cluster assembly protein SufD [Pseudomonadota bacterium]